MLTQRKRTHGSWGIEQLFKCPCTIVRWPLKHCSLEHEECFHHQMWQMAWNFHHFILPKHPFISTLPNNKIGRDDNGA